MENPDKLYIIFAAGGSLFLIPFCRLKQIGEKASGESEVIDFAELAGKHAIEAERPYFIFLGYGEDRELCIKAEEIPGICEIEPQEIMALGEPVVYEKNRYITGAVYHEIPAKGLRISYVVDLEELGGRGSTSWNTSH